MVARLLVAVFVLAAACEKTPAEPSLQPAAGSLPNAAAAARPGGSTRAPSEAPRCVRPLAPSPPPSPKQGPDPACPRDPQGGPPMVPAGHVSFPQAANAPRLEVELMLTEATQERGLMFRKSLADDRGMLFAWPEPTVHTFWMHNTCIPLDMLFIDASGFVAGIVESAPTLNDEPRSIDCPASYVLEVNAGWSRRHGVAPGQKVLIEGVPFGR